MVFIWNLSFTFDVIRNFNYFSIFSKCTLTDIRKPRRFTTTFFCLHEILYHFTDFGFYNTAIINNISLKYISHFLLENIFLYTFFYKELLKNMWLLYNIMIEYRNKTFSCTLFCSDISADL